MSLRPLVHLALHLGLPAALARALFPGRWLRVWLVLLAALAIDLDHLLATPLYDPDRCSLGVHPLHSAAAAGVYLVAAAAPRLRLLALGLAIHLGLDALDCAWMRWG